MSIRFATRVVANRYSETLDPDYLGPSKNQRLRAGIQNAAYAAYGAVIASASSDPLMQIIFPSFMLATGVAHLYNASRAAVGSPENLRNQDAAVGAFGYSAATLLSMHGAAVALAAKNVADLVIGEGVERLTRPKPHQVDELVGVIKSPRSDRHRKVAVQDLLHLPEVALIAINDAIRETADPGQRARLTAAAHELNKRSTVPLAGAEEFARQQAAA